MLLTPSRSQKGFVDHLRSLGCNPLGLSRAMRVLNLGNELRQSFANEEQSTKESSLVRISTSLPSFFRRLGVCPLLVGFLAVVGTAGLNAQPLTVHRFVGNFGGSGLFMNVQGFSAGPIAATLAAAAAFGGQRRHPNPFGGQAGLWKWLTTTSSDASQLSHLVTGARYHNPQHIREVNGEHMTPPVVFNDKRGGLVILEPYSDDHDGFMRVGTTPFRVLSRHTARETT
jgi:hypothetical protein